YRQEAPGAVAQRVGQKQQAEVADKNDEDIQRLDVGSHRNPGHDGAEQQRQGQQGVSVADEFVGSERLFAWHASSADLFGHDQVTSLIPKTSLRIRKRLFRKSSWLNSSQPAGFVPVRCDRAGAQAADRVVANY